MILRRRYKIENVAEKKRNEWVTLFVRLFVALVLVFFSIFFIWYAIFLSSHSYYRVDGASMVPTLNADISPSKFDEAQGISYDCVYVDKKADPKLFDVVVINTHQKNADKTNKTIIKRLMATGGDFVTVAKTVDQDGTERMGFFRIPKGTDRADYLDEQGLLLESGENGYEIYEPNSIWAHKKNFEQPLTFSLKVKVGGEEIENEYDYNFYLTFLKQYGSENESFGYFVSSTGLLYVQVPEGSFFYLGDNRAHSSDSREDGFRKVEDIVGPVEIVIYNNNFFKRIGTFMTYFFKEVEKFFAR